MPKHRILGAMMRFALAKTENLYFSPDWWEGLGDSDRNDVLDMFNIGIVPTRPETPEALVSGKVPRLGCRVVKTAIELPEEAVSS